MAKKKKKGNKYAHVIGGELDLHGLTAYQAVQELASFIHDKEVDQVEYIRVITGKGLRSEYGPVLPHAVRSWLNEHGYHYNEAKRSEGGEGALVVTLFSK